MNTKKTRFTRNTLRIILLTSIFTLAFFTINITEHKSTIRVDSKFKECYSNCNGVLLPIEKASPIDIYEAKKTAEYMKGIERRKVELAKIAEEKRLAEIERIRLVELEAKRIARQKEKAEAKKKQTVSRGSGYQTNYEVTHYTAKCEGCTGYTATSFDVRNTVYYQGYRIVAAPKNIPFYTKLRITYDNGATINAIVLDRGGAIKGKLLDILVSSKDEAYQLGRQQVKVEVIQ